jgi:hypothetical protein
MCSTSTLAGAIAKGWLLRSLYSRDGTLAVLLCSKGALAYSILYRTDGGAHGPQ